MSRDWGLVGLSLAIMALAGSIAANAYWGTPFDVGTLGQWASAFGTLVAVWVALRNTRTTLDKTAEREAIKSSEAAKSYLEAVNAVTLLGKLGITTIHSSVGKADLAPADVRRLLSITHLEGLLGTLDRIPIHSAPDSRLIPNMSATRTAIFNAYRLLSEAGALDKPSKINVENELELMSKTRTKFEALYGELDAKYRAHL